MAEDLPIYSESMLRTRLQFADLERLKGVDTSSIWDKSDPLLEQFEGGTNVRQAREAVRELAKAGLLQIHATLFGADTLRQQPIKPLFRGQDCPDPEFIDRSLDNFYSWLTAESLAEIHPIERAALTLTRIVDIWPFDAGNLTVAIMVANIGLRQSGLAPFFIQPEHRKEFNTVIAQALTIETQPLVNAIYKTIKREMEALSRDDRYSRQTRFAPIGEAGQQRLASARILVIGLGALGTVAADQVVRAGVGFVKLIDRDFVELSNLQRQSLFDEEDIRNNLPKAAAAEARLRRVNSSVEIEAIVDDVNPSNIEDYLSDVDLVLDALDNFETRFVVNDACAKHGKPWIYTAAVGSYGLVMPVLPRITPCLRCLMGNMPAPGTSPTCETAGVVAPITHIMASIQVAEALKFLTGNLDPSDVRLIAYDVWSHRFQRIDVGQDAMATCPVCSEGKYDYLDGNPLRTITLCGRNAVQLIPGVRGDINFEELAKSIAAFGTVQFNDFLLRCSAPPYELTLFKDGRAIVKGTEEAGTARSVYSKMVGL